MALTTAPTIPRWKQRFEQRGMAGLDPCHEGSQPRVANTAMPRITRKTQQQVDHAPRMGTGPSEGAPFGSLHESAAWGRILRGCKRRRFQGLDRLNPLLPLPPSRAERHVQAITAKRHTSQDFIDILQDLVKRTALGPSRFMSCSTIWRRIRPRTSSGTRKCGFTSLRLAHAG